MAIRKLIIGCITATLFCIMQTANAQWSSESNVNTKTVTNVSSSTTRPSIVAGPGGSSYIRWIQNDTLSSGNAAMCMFVQKMDRKGNRVWNQSKGVRIDSLIGMTQYADNMSTDNDGNLIVASQNARYDNAHQCPVITKINASTGAIIWQKNIDTVPGSNDKSGMAPVIGITPGNNIVIAWVNSKLIKGSSELAGIYMHKLNGANGNFMWPGRVCVSEDTTEGTNLSQIIMLPNSENSIVVWGYRNAGVAGSIPFNLRAKKFDINGTALTTTATEISATHLNQPGSFPTLINDKQGGVLVYFRSPGAKGNELYAQRIDTATAANMWGTEAKLIAKNIISSSADDGGVAYDSVNKKLWVAVMYAAPINRTQGTGAYLQGLNLSGNRLLGFPNDSTSGPQLLAVSDGSNATAPSGLALRYTGDGLIWVYTEGLYPNPVTLKATKIDFTGKKMWAMPDADSVLTVSNVKGLTNAARNVVTEYMPADSQLVVAMYGTPTLNTTQQLAQNIKNSQVTGGTIGNGTIRQNVIFDTTAVYITYGDAVPYLGGISDAGISPVYLTDDATIIAAPDSVHLSTQSGGVAHITAYFPGSDVYIAKKYKYAKPIYVAKKNINVIADNKTQAYGHPIPTLTMHFDAFINNDDVSSFTELPTIVTPAKMNSPLGVYPITLQGGLSPKYIPVLTNAQLTIYPANGANGDKLEAYNDGGGRLQVNIYTNKQDQTGTVQLIDMSGKILYSKHINLTGLVTNVQIPTYTVMPAIYVVRFVGTQSVLDQKVKL